MATKRKTESKASVPAVRRSKKEAAEQAQWEAEVIAPVRERQEEHLGSGKSRLRRILMTTASENADPVEVLRGMGLDVQMAEAVLASGVIFGRSQGLSWRQIGDALGISEQAAYKRWRTVTAVDPDSSVGTTVTSDDRRVWPSAAQAVGAWWSSADTPGSRLARQSMATDTTAVQKVEP